MKHLVTGCKITGIFAILMTGFFCSCAGTQSNNSSAEKERQAWYSNYVDNTEKEWSTHF